MLAILRDLTGSFAAGFYMVAIADVLTLLMLHGAGADEGTYLDQVNGLLMRLAERHGYILVSPLGFTPLGAHGNPLRLPAFFGQTAAAAGFRQAFPQSAKSDPFHDLKEGDECTRWPVS
jgi:predicted esterase